MTDWKLLLIGGASGVGKTEVAERIARRTGATLVQMDDFQALLEALTNPEQCPILHRWRVDPDVGSWTVDDFVRQTIAIGEWLGPGIEAVVADRLTERRRIVLEGDFLLPSVARRCLALGEVRCAFLHEPSTDRIAENYRLREPEAGDQSFRAAVSAAYSRWLAEDAARVGIPVVGARPWRTAAMRVLCRIAEGRQEGRDDG